MSAMSLSKLINRQFYRKANNCKIDFIINTRNDLLKIKCNSIESTKREFNSILIKNNLLNKGNNEWIECNNRGKNRRIIISVEWIQKRFFKQRDKFSHQKNLIVETKFQKCFHLVVVMIVLINLFNVGNIWNSYIPDSVTDPIEDRVNRFIKACKRLVGVKRVDALSYDNTSAANNEDITNDFELKSDSKLRKSGFRDRKIIEYENRIRMYSTPDKIFRYFASIKIIYDQNESEIYMTPDDFLRALTPGIKQPDGLGLDQFKKIDISKEEETDLNAMLSKAGNNCYCLLTGSKDLAYGLKPNSIFYKLSNYGLINFTDFLFLLTVISVSRRHFEIAFRMFDLNGDGDVEYEEFEKVQNAILAQTSIGRKLHGNAKTKYIGVSSALAKYFFGEDLKQKLTTEKFLDFQRQLQTELLTLEFERKKPNPITGKIKETEFADLLIAYAGLTDKRRTKVLKRVKKKFGKDVEGLEQEGISLDDYLRLFYFLQNINDVDIALAVFHIAGASIDQATLKHVAKTVAHVELRDHLVDVLFTIFDENQDGQLSNREFIAVMKERLRRGLAKPKDTGFFKLLHAIWNSLKFDF